MNYRKILMQTEFELHNTNAPIVIWGAGIMGQMALKVLRYLGKEPICFCDMNEELKVIDICGYPVLSVREAISKYSRSLIILCVGLMGNSYQKEEQAVQLAQKLEHAGKIISSDIIHYIYNTKVLKRGISSDNYANTIRSLRYSDNILHRLSIVITDKCTLNCRDCGMLIPYKKPGKDADIDVIITAVKKLFSVVDGIRWVQIFGGEPFLYPKLTEVTQKIAEIDQALSIVITTNATLPPCQEQYDKLARCVSYFTISNYGETLSKYCNEIKNVCSNSGMIFSESNYHTEGMLWTTNGSICENHFTIAQKEAVFDNCMRAECNCRISPDGIFYFCERQLIPSINRLTTTQKEIIHLEDPEITGVKLKEKWKRIRSLSFIEACGYCNSGKSVFPAIQAKGKLNYKDMGC